MLNFKILIVSCMTKCLIFQNSVTYRLIIASDITCKSREKRSRYSDRAVTAVREVVVTALLEYLNLQALIAL